jgi:hypothetical protein
VEEEFEYYPDVGPGRGESMEKASEEERWWTPDPSWLQSEDDEEEARYLNTILSEKQDEAEGQASALESLSLPGGAREMTYYNSP